MALRRLCTTGAQVEARTSPGTVEVYGEPVALPSAFDRVADRAAFDEVDRANAADQVVSTPVRRGGV